MWRSVDKKKCSSGVVHGTDHGPTSHVSTARPHDRDILMVWLHGSRDYGCHGGLVKAVTGRGGTGGRMREAGETAQLLL